MAIAWDPALAVGVAEIDDQHRELFRRVDALIESVQARRSAAEAARLLEYLDEYVVSHFGAEEALMKASRYPGLAEHQVEHARLIEDLAALREEYRRDGATALLVVRVNARVTQWLFQHINRTDRALGAFLLTHRRASA